MRSRRLFQSSFQSCRRRPSTALLLALALGFSSGASAQDGANKPAARDPSEQQVITVTGRAADAPKSDWRRAEGDHVIVYSRGGEGELKRVTRNLEFLHGLMSRLYRRGQTTDDAAKIEIVLIDSQARFHALQLRDLRSQEGPYSGGFLQQDYYDPRDDRAILAVSRSDQSIDLDTQRRRNLDCDDYYANGGDGPCGSLLQPPPSTDRSPHVGGTNANAQGPTIRGWEAKLYSGFAQHFLLTYAPAAYPRWYLDGIGAVFSTIVVQPNGAMDYARAPASAKGVFLSYDYPDVGAVLTGAYLGGEKPKRAAWSPYCAWLVAYYFVFSNPKPERLQQFDRYMAAIRQGKPMAEAAAVFGDFGKLQREVIDRLDRPLFYAHADPPAEPVGDPILTSLSVAGGAVVETRLELDTRLAAPGGATEWVTRLRDRVTGLGFDRDAYLLLAEAECRSGDGAHCLETAGQVLAAAKDDVRALAWQGWAMTEAALAGPPDVRADRLAEARKPIERAIALDDRATLPRIAYFRSFTAAGVPAPAEAIRGMGMVVRAIPAAPGPRLALGEELVRTGQADLARRLLFPVLFGPYDSPERTAAAGLFGARGGSASPAAR